MFHSYDVIKQLNTGKCITCDYGVYISVISGAKIIKKSTKNARVIVENKAVPFFMKHGV